jgi:hypothetical protein
MPEDDQFFKQEEYKQTILEEPEDCEEDLLETKPKIIIVSEEEGLKER